MQIATFNAKCPYEIGDKIQVIETAGKYFLQVVKR